MLVQIVSGGHSAEFIFRLCLVRFNTVNTDIPIWAVVCRLLLSSPGFLCLSSWKTKILFSDDCLFLSINREEGSRMDTTLSTNPVCSILVNWLLPHSWNLAKPTLTRLVYVSFISESTFPHWFLLIRPARGCFAGPRRVRSHCVTTVGSNSVDKPRNDVIYPDLFFKPNLHPLWDFYPPFLWILVAAAQITNLWSLREEQAVFYVEETATYPTVRFSCDYFCSRKGNVGTWDSASRKKIRQQY